jgi:hypothetical protein
MGAVLSFEQEAKTAKRLDAEAYDRYYPKLDYYKVKVVQDNRLDVVIGTPTIVDYELVGKIPVYIQVKENQELKDKYNLPSDFVDLSITLSITWFDINNVEHPKNGYQITYNDVRYEFLKIIPFDPYRNTGIYFHYIVPCRRFKETKVIRDPNADVKIITKGKSANQSDNYYRETRRVFDPDIDTKISG